MEFMKEIKKVENKMLGGEAAEVLYQNDKTLEGGINYSSIVNVGNLKPLTSGYYTLATAIAALDSTSVYSGMVITYQINESDWEVKQFIGNDIAEIATESLWKDIASFKSLYNVSQENNKYDYPDKQAARNAVPVNKRSRLQVVVYSVGGTNGWQESRNFTRQDNYSINHKNGELQAGQNQLAITIPLSGISRIKTLARVADPLTGTSGGAFYDSNGNYISGFLDDRNDSSLAGTFIERNIPISASVLKASYFTDSYAEANGLALWEYVLIGSYSTQEGSEHVDLYVGDDLSEWGIESNWKELALSKDYKGDTVQYAPENIYDRLYGGEGVKTVASYSVGPGVAHTNAGDFYYNNYLSYRGKRIESIELNVDVDGLFSIIAGKNPNSSNYTSRVIQKSVTAGYNKIDLDLQLEPDEVIGFSRKTDTSKLMINDTLANPLAGGCFWYNPVANIWSGSMGANINICIGINIYDGHVGGEISELYNLLNSKAEATKFSFLGNSIETFTGVSIGNSQYDAYPKQTDVSTVEKTWWGKLLKKTNSSLAINNSFGGSTITINQVDPVNYPSMTDESRLTNLGDFDVLFWSGGTNDYGRTPATIGTSFNYSKPLSELDRNVFNDALIYGIRRLLELYPGKDIWLLSPTHRTNDTNTNSKGNTLSDYSNSIKTIGSHYGLHVVDMFECGINASNLSTYTTDGLHPNAAGMELMADYIYSIYSNLNRISLSDVPGIDTDKAPNLKLFTENVFYITQEDNPSIWTNISNQVVTGIAYKGTDGLIANYPEWSSVTFDVQEGDTVVFRGAVAVNAVGYSSDTVFNSTTKLFNIEPLAMVNGVYQIPISNNCVLLAVNFKNAENPDYSNIEQGQREFTITSDVKNEITKLNNRVDNIDPSDSTISSDGFMKKNETLFDGTNKTLVYSKTGYGTLVHMFFAGDWDKVEDTTLYVEVDGGITSLVGTLYELIGIGIISTFNSSKNQLLNSLFGRNGAKNGIYLNYKVPYHTDIKVYLQKSSSSSAANPAFFFTARTVSTISLEVGGIKLPVDAVMRTYYNESTTQPLDYHEILNTQNSGAIISLFVDGLSTNQRFLEACIRAYIKGSATPTLYSSGLEDYFLGTYYWRDVELYYTDVAGLTHLDSSSFSAYRLHIVDPILYEAGGYRLTVRCGETEHGTETGNPQNDPQPTTYRTRVIVYEW